MKSPLISFQLKDALRNRWLLVYALVIWGITDLLLRFGGSDGQVLISLSNVLILFVPLIAVIQSAMYVYGNREYIELMLTQPVSRTQIWLSLWIGFSLPFVLVLFVAILLPFAYLLTSWATFAQVVLVAVTASLLSAIFSAVAFWLAFKIDDRTKGLAMVLGLWIVMAIIYDGLILILLQMFADYPIEGFLLAITVFNPIDLGRISMLLQMNTSAMMGYTGALFKQWMGAGGIFYALGLLIVWLTVPLTFSLRTFKNKDF
jgi:Cu-processing system permease protein